MAPNSSWIILCVKRNLWYIKPNRYSTVQSNCTVSIFVKLSDRPVVFTFTFSERRYIKLEVWRVHTIVNNWNSKYIQYLIDPSLASITAAILLGIDWKSFSSMTQSTSLQSFLISFSNSKYFVIWPFFYAKKLLFKPNYAQWSWDQDYRPAIPWSKNFAGPATTLSAWTCDNEHCLA